MNMNANYCQRCGQALGAKARFCPACGRPTGLGAWKAWQTLLVVFGSMFLALVVATGVGLGYRRHRRGAAENVLKANLSIMRHAIEQYRADRGGYPPSLDDLWRDASKRYLVSIPIDPMTRTDKTWVVEMGPPGPGGEAGVSNVRSGAEGTDRDGRPYGDY
jgi:general secretion pathway protein G